MSADPSEENIFSIKALLSNDFKKKKDEDYRKKNNYKIIEQLGLISARMNIRHPNTTEV